jgi:hypothetical protein
MNISATGRGSVAAGSITGNVSMGAVHPPGVISRRVMDSVQDEATRAHSKHGVKSMLGTGYTDHERLAILVEEVGEVAHELTYDQDPVNRVQRLRDELAQVAAMAATWIEFIDRKGSHGDL